MQDLTGFIIPAIDLIDGKCVRLSGGNFNEKKIYNENPLSQAEIFESAGLRRLHMVDLDGAKSGHVQNLKVLERVARSTGLQIDYSGGIKHSEDLDAVFNAGASFAAVGSMAVREPEIFLEWTERYGKQKFLLGADVRDNMVAVDGWQSTASKEIISYLDFYAKKGICNVFCTDIEKDGMLSGPSFGLYRKIQEACPDIKLIASGGISSLDDVLKLRDQGLHAAIVGKAIYENQIILSDLIKKV